MRRILYSAAFRTRPIGHHRVWYPVPPVPMCCRPKGDPKCNASTVLTSTCIEVRSPPPAPPSTRAIRKNTLLFSTVGWSPNPSSHPPFCPSPSPACSPAPAPTSLPPSSGRRWCSLTRCRLRACNLTLAHTIPLLLHSPGKVSWEEG